MAMPKAPALPNTTASSLAAAAPAVVAHTHIRLRGHQQGDLTVYHARTPQARVALVLGPTLATFWSAAAAQGVLEGFSAARTALITIPAQLPVIDDPLGQPAVAVDWTQRPHYAVVPQARVSEAQRRTLKWVDIHMGPITFQLLDRAAFHSTLELLSEAHRTAVAVCLDGHTHRADPTGDDYVPRQPAQ
ncbi:hypothetical protein [Mycolicibacterium llatzerense]|uniref:hypothetical protein n=1 Tax=Mycolicibacterium llatzerense TaxID=280871 RepID=UPI001F2721A7|nr:hypothetical protein [Mycolicibacterium llatzerense]